MATDFTTYQDPGVYVEEINTPVVSSVGISPVNICLIGVGQDFQITTETDQLDINTPFNDTTLAQLGINPSTIVVTDRYTGVLYEITTDYLVVSTGVEPSNTVTVQAVDGGGITGTVGGGQGDNPSQGWVNISYQYTGPDYYQPYNFNSYDAVTTMYGQPYNSDGSINSPLSLGALLAFANGAPQITATAVYSETPQSPTNSDWSNTINSLQSESQIDVYIPLTGTLAVLESLDSFVTLQQGNGTYCRGFVGHDGITNPSDVAPITQDFDFQRMTVCSPSIFNVQTGVVAGVIPIGGQYAAAAVGGLFASQVGTQVPLTWKTLTGFYNIPNQVSQQLQVQQQMSGILVILQRRDGTIIVKHGLTTDMTNFLTQEISVQASQDKLYQLIDDTLLAQGLVGSVLNAATANSVVGSVVTALSNAIGAGLISNYSGLQYQVPVGQPTTINVRFQYQPSLPLNYIQVQFGIDTSTGSTAFSSTATPFNNATSSLATSSTLGQNTV